MKNFWKIFEKKNFFWIFFFRNRSRKCIFLNRKPSFKKTIWPIFRAVFESEVKIGHITSEKCEIRLSNFFKIKTSDNKKTSDSDVFFLKRNEMRHVFIQPRHGAPSHTGSRRDILQNEKSAILAQNRPFLGGFLPVASVWSYLFLCRNAYLFVLPGRGLLASLFDFRPKLNYRRTSSKVSRGFS